MAPKKGPSKGTGGHGKRRLEGKGPTPPARERTGHPAQRRAAAAERAAARQGGGRGERPSRSSGAAPAEEVVVGRNPVVEALRARVPAVALYLATGLESDARLDEARRLAGNRKVPLLDAGRHELDRLAGGAPHQGVVLHVRPFAYLHPDDLMRASQERSAAPLLVALDGVTDPHNVGAIARSAAAFGADGLLLPERRAAGVTAAAWKASAGALARLPVARATNLVRTLKAYAAEGFMIVGLDADGEVDVDGLEVATGPLVVVVGSEGRGLSRLVGETCDLRARIPIGSDVESLNASVAAGVALAAVARRRRTG